MASKKEWKRRCKAQERTANELFTQCVARAEELAVIDKMLLEAEFAGPTIEAYVAQTQQFLQRLVNERKLSKKSSLASPSDLPQESSTSAPVSSSGQESIVEGEYNLMKMPSVPAGGGRFA